MAEWNKNKTLKVLMTTDTVGGVWTYCMELCRALQPANVHFYLVTTGALMRPSQNKEVKRLNNVSVFETDFLLEWMKDPWKSIDASGAWLLKLADRLQPDLIHLNAFSYASLPWKVPVIVTAHSDVFSWWLAVKKEYAPAEWNEYFKRVANGLQQADFIVAVSKTTMSSIRNIYTTTAAGKVIYNGRNDGLFFSAIKNKTVFSMGRIWDEAKNISLLVEAADKISYPVRLAGDKNFDNESCNTAGSNITHLGQLSEDEIAAELAKAAVYVLPAKYEPFGLSILEAALSGCALVLGKIDSLQEIWGDAALYVDTDNADELADSINLLMKNDPMRLHFSKKAMTTAKKYSISAMANNYRNLYQQISEHSIAV
jgi:glycogen synthase